MAAAAALGFNAGMATTASTRLLGNYVGGRWVAATAGTVAGFTAASAAQLAATLRRMLATYTAPDNA